MAEVVTTSQVNILPTLSQEVREKKKRKEMETILKAFWLQVGAGEWSKG